ERQALKKETDTSSKERLKKIDEDLKSLREQSNTLRAQWQKERQEVTQLNELKGEIEQKRFEMEQAEKNGNLEKAAELKYGVLLELQKKLDESTSKAKERRILHQEVDENHIAEVVS